MDSLTQAALGAGIAGALAPAGLRRRAMLLGAALGTLPDLDVLIDYGDDVANFTRHRGFSHSLFVLAPVALVLWLLLRAAWAPVRAAPGRWLIIVALALLTHPLLDAHTAYGTQLFWPLPTPPVMWGTIFIIDPAYTVPLVVAAIVTLLRPEGRAARRWLPAALAVSTLYLGWTWLAQSWVRHDAAMSLDARGVRPTAMFVTPTPFNSVLWRVVAMTDDGYLEGFDSLVLDEPAIRFRAHSSDVAALAAAAGIAAVDRLQWFAGGFVRAEVVDGRLLIADLRMGQDPIYVFTHAVATHGNPRWHAIDPVRLPVSFADRSLGEVWERIWSEPGSAEDVGPAPQ